MSPFKNRIGSNWVGSSDGTMFENYNPAHPDQVLGEFPQSTRSDAQQAVRAAREAFQGWAGTPAPDRGALLERAGGIVESRLDEMAAVLTSEEGKTLAEAKAEIERIILILRYYSGEGWRMGGEVLPGNRRGQHLYTRREPLGVISVVTPWNYPALIPAWKIAPALVYGNTVVFKPASQAPQVGLMLVEALLEAGLPDGVLNFVTGSGSVVGDELVRNPDVMGVSFTGSYVVGSQVHGAASESMKRIQCEMGGKNALIVLADAEIDLAVDLAIKGGFGVTGQACTATSRVIVEPGVADDFVEALTESARDLVVGDGLESGTQMGPSVSRDQMETVLGFVKLGEEEGARLVSGGGAVGDEGYFLQPTVFDLVAPDMRIAQEEIFGPVIGVIRAKGFDDAIEIANRISYGLSAGIVTNDLQRAFTFAERIEAGVVKINEPTNGLALHAPFGGFKHSSANTFKEQGQAAIEFYTRTKVIYMNYR